MIKLSPRPNSDFGRSSTFETLRLPFIFLTDLSGDGFCRWRKAQYYYRCLSKPDARSSRFYFAMRRLISEIMVTETRKSMTAGLDIMLYLLAVTVTMKLGISTIPLLLLNYTTAVQNIS
jgi:hypothetical protein